MSPSLSLAKALRTQRLFHSKEIKMEKMHLIIIINM